MKTNRAGVDLIKRWESLRREAYPDPGTKDDPVKRGEPWTIGYGHTGGVRPGMRITEAQAEEYLRADLAHFEAGVLRLTAGVTLTENQFSALVSLAFNIGLGDERKPPGQRKGLADSTLLKLLRAGDMAGAAEQFTVWRKANGQVMAGLVSRRADERALFLRAA